MLGAGIAGSSVARAMASGGAAAAGTAMDDSYRNESQLQKSGKISAARLGGCKAGEGRGGWKWDLEDNVSDSPALKLGRPTFLRASSARQHGRSAHVSLRWQLVAHPSGATPLLWSGHGPILHVYARGVRSVHKTEHLTLLFVPLLPRPRICRSVPERRVGANWLNAGRIAQPCKNGADPAACLPELG